MAETFFDRTRGMTAVTGEMARNFCGEFEDASIVSDLPGGGMWGTQFTVHHNQAKRLIADTLGNSEMSFPIEARVWNRAASSYASGEVIHITSVSYNAAGDTVNFTRPANFGQRIFMHSDMAVAKKSTQAVFNTEASRRALALGVTAHEFGHIIGWPHNIEDQTLGNDPGYVESRDGFDRLMTWGPYEYPDRCGVTSYEAAHFDTAVMVSQSLPVYNNGW